LVLHLLGDGAGEGAVDSLGGGDELGGELAVVPARAAADARGGGPREVAARARRRALHLATHRADELELRVLHLVEERFC